MEKLAISSEKRKEKLLEQASKRKNKGTTLSYLPADGSNSKFLAHNLELSDLPPCDMSSTEAVRTRMNEYFNICIKNDMKPSIVSLALALGIGKMQLYRLCKGEQGKNAEVREMLNQIYVLLEAQMIDYMQNGKVNPVTGIFLSKNWFNYADKTELVVNSEQPLGDDIDPEQLKNKYLESTIPIDTTADEC